MYLWDFFVNVTIHGNFYFLGGDFKLGEHIIEKLEGKRPDLIHCRHCRTSKKSYQVKKSLASFYRHLEKEHKVQVYEGPSKKSKSSNQASVIAQLLDNRDGKVVVSRRNLAYTDDSRMFLLIRMIVKNDLPFSAVEWVELRDYESLLKPGNFHYYFNK